MINALEHRQPDHLVERLLVARWSPRAMSGTPLTDSQIHSLFEAARWAPSTYNEQEWRFLYSRRETPQWQTFFDLLVEGNQTWCRNAGMLVVIVAHKVFSLNGKTNPVHLFDTGAAFENLALQGTAMNLVVHGMAGFDWDKAAADLKIPADYEVAAMFAVGHHGKIEDLPEDYREGEIPNGRKKISEISCVGAFSF